MADVMSALQNVLLIFLLTPTNSLNGCHFVFEKLRPLRLVRTDPTLISATMTSVARFNSVRSFPMPGNPPRCKVTGMLSAHASGGYKRYKNVFLTSSLPLPVSARPTRASVSEVFPRSGVPYSLFDRGVKITIVSINVR